MPWESLRRNQSGRAAVPPPVRSASSSPDLVRRIQQTYGNRAVQRLVKSASVASTTAPRAAAIIQRFGNIRFANVATTKPKYREKANDIITSLQGTPAIATFLNNKNALITLEYEPMLASVRVVGDQVLIKLSP